jgi:hypothetical protein
MRGLVFALFLFGFSANGVSATEDSSTCQNRFSRVVYAALKATHFVVRSGVLPVSLPLQYLTRRPSEDGAKETKVETAISIAASNRREFLAYLGLISFNLAYPMVIEDEDLQSKTDVLLNDHPDGPIVFVNGFDSRGEDASLYYNSKEQFERLYKTNKNSNYIEVTSLDDLLLQLAAITYSAGRISLLEVRAHGMAGAILLGTEIVRRSDLLDRQASDATLVAQMDEGFKNIDVVLAPGAQVRIAGCATGLGKSGESFVEALGKLLLPYGGRIVANRLNSEAPKEGQFGMVVVQNGADFVSPLAKTMHGLYMNFYLNQNESFSRKVNAVLNPILIYEVPAEPEGSPFRPDSFNR